MAIEDVGNAIADAVPAPGVGGPSAAPEPKAPDAPQAPADLPPQAQMPEPSPEKSSAKKDDDKEEKKQEQNNLFDPLKPKAPGKDEEKRAAGDQMKLVDQLNDTVGQINDQVTEAFKGAAQDAIKGGIDKIRGYMEKDMPEVKTGPSAPMESAADTPEQPMASAKAGVASAEVPEPTAPAPSAPSIPGADAVADAVSNVVPK